MRQCGLGNPGVTERTGVLDTAEFQSTEAGKLVMVSELGRGLSARLTINCKPRHDQVTALCVRALKRAEM